MKTYRVYMQNVVSYYVDIEAVDSAEAMDKAETNGLPGLMMLDHRYPDESGWEATEADEVKEL